MTTPLWHKLKGWLGTNGEAPVATRGTVLRAPDSEAAPPVPAAPVPAPAPTLKKPDSLTPGQGAVAPNRPVKSSTVYPLGHVIAGRYKVERVFEGGMGYVYITQDRTQNLRFAIKQPKAMMLQVPDFFARVVREADAWTGLGMHPHIAYCYFVRSIEDVPHIFVEYVDGGTLQDWIADGNCLDYRVGLDLAIQCCHGMERAHRWGLLHRDLKPANILVTRDGLAKVTDFGLVGEATPAERRQVVGPARGETTYGMQMGTPEYMAPEQGRDPRRRSDSVPDGVWYDSDVYSFGLCLWEMVCGRLPFAHWAAHTGQLPEPREARRDLPASLRTLLLEVIALDRRQRPQDFAQLRERLNGIYRELFRQDAPHYRIPVLDTSAAELTNQGYSYYELGKRDEALACFRQAVEKDPTHPQAVYNLSLLQWRAGEIDDLEVLRRLDNCGNNPENSTETLAELTAQVHAERSDPDAARALLQTYPGRYEALFAGIEIRPIQCRHTLTGHRSEVCTVTVTGDGRRALSGSSVEFPESKQDIKLWDLETGQCLRTLNSTILGLPVAMTNDGSRALSAWSGLLENTLKFWDLAKGKCLHTLTGHTGEVHAIAITGNGRWALSASEDNTLKLWDLAKGKCLRTLTGHTDKVEAVAMTSDGQRALSGSYDRTLKLWDLETGQCLRTLIGHTSRVNAVAVTSDGQRALSVGWSFAETKLWDLATGQCLRTLDLNIHTNERYPYISTNKRFIPSWVAWVPAVAIIGNGQRALSGNEDGTLKLWDLETGRCLRTLTGHTSCVRAVVAIGDGRRALSGSYDQTLKLWDLVPGTYRAVLQVAPPQGWAEKYQTHTALQQALLQIDACLARGSFRDAYTILLAIWMGIEFRPDTALQERYGRLIRQGRITNLRVGYQMRTLIKHNTYGVHAVAVTGDGRRALSGTRDGTLNLWDLETGESLRTLTGHNLGITRFCMAMTGDGRRALSGTEDRTLKLWDLETGQCLRILIGHMNRVNAVAVTSDGRWALSADGFETKLWDLATGQCLHPLWYAGSVHAVAVTNDGWWALSASLDDNTLKFWNLETGVCLRTLTGHTSWVRAVAVTDNGRRALSGSSDKTLKLWDLETGVCLHTLTGHTGSVETVAMTSDGRRALSGSSDKTLKLWDLETGVCLHTLTGHTGSVETVAMTSDGQRVLSGGEDKTLILWQLIWDLEFPDQK